MNRFLLTSLLLAYQKSTNRSVLTIAVCDFDRHGPKHRALPETAQEAAELEVLYGRHGFSVQTLLNQEATENRLHQLEQTGKLADFREAPLLKSHTEEENMTELTLRFEFSQDNDLNLVAKMLEKRSGQLPMVDAVESVSEKMKLIGVELASAIGVTILVVRSSRELIGEIRKLITEIKEFSSDLHDLKNIFFDVGDQRVQLEDLDDEHLRLMDKARRCFAASSQHVDFPADFQRSAQGITLFRQFCRRLCLCCRMDSILAERSGSQGFRAAAEMMLKGFRYGKATDTPRIFSADHPTTKGLGINSQLRYLRFESF